MVPFEMYLNLFPGMYVIVCRDVMEWWHDRFHIELTTFKGTNSTKLSNPFLYFDNSLNLLTIFVVPLDLMQNFSSIHAKLSNTVLLQIVQAIHTRAMNRSFMFS